MSYSASDNMITRPVSINDLQRCLKVVVSVDGVKGRTADLGLHINSNAGQSYVVQGKVVSIVSREKINKWAKYKPVRNSHPVTAFPGSNYNASTGQWINTSDYMNWWQTGGTCGMKIDTFSDIGEITHVGNGTVNRDSFIYKLIHNELPWTYLPPRGSSNSEYYRIADFNQYFHAAQPPLGEFGQADKKITVTTNGDGTRTFTLNWESNNSDIYDNKSLMYKDFKVSNVNLSDMYLGVIMRRDNASETDGSYLCVTSQTPVGNADGSVMEVKIGYSSIGKWKVFPFLSSVPYKADDGKKEGIYISAGYENADGNNWELVELTEEGTNRFDPDSLSAEWNDDNTAVTFAFNIVNDSTVVHNYEEVYVAIYKNNTSDELVAGMSFRNVSVNGGQTVTKSGQIEVQKEANTEYWITVTDKTTGTTIPYIEAPVEGNGQMILE